MTPSVANDAASGPRWRFPVIAAGSYEEARRHFRWLDAIGAESAYLQACQDRLDNLVGGGVGLRLVGVTADELRLLTRDFGWSFDSAGVFDSGLAAPLGWLAGEVDYHGDVRRDRLYATLRRRLLERTGQETREILFESVQDFTDLAGRYLHGVANLVVRVESLEVAISAVGDGRGHVHAGASHLDDLLRVALAAGMHFGGRLVVRAAQPDLFVQGMYPYELIGWDLREGHAFGLSEADLFDELCHDVGGEIVPPDGRVRLVSPLY